MLDPLRWKICLRVHACSAQCDARHTQGHRLEWRYMACQSLDVSRFAMSIIMMFWKLTYVNEQYNKLNCKYHSVYWHSYLILVAYHVNRSNQLSSSVSLVSNAQVQATLKCLCILQRILESFKKRFFKSRKLIRLLITPIPHRSREAHVNGHHMFSRSYSFQSSHNRVINNLNITGRFTHSYRQIICR